MGNLASGLAAIMVICFAALCCIVYHSIFDVVYFDFSKGFAKELVGYILGGMLLAGITVKIWWVIAIIIAIVAFVAFKKGKTGTAILCVAMIIFVTIVGISVNRDVKKESSAIDNSYSINQNCKIDYFIS